MKRASTVLLAAAGAVALVAGPAVAGPVNTNSAGYWSAKLSLTCSKTEYAASPEVTSWTSDGYYAAVIIKAGSVDTGDGPGVVVYRNVLPGQTFDSATNAAGQIAGISWLMTCTGGSSSGSS